MLPFQNPSRSMCEDGNLWKKLAESWRRRGLWKAICRRPCHFFVKYYSGLSSSIRQRRRASDVEAPWRPLDPTKLAQTGILQTSQGPKRTTDRLGRPILCANHRFA